MDYESLFLLRLLQNFSFETATDEKRMFCRTEVRAPKAKNCKSQCKTNRVLQQPHLIRRRIESRYQRILFVQKELAKLDAPEQPEGSFEDFVFKHIDFSIYKKIDAGEFKLLFEEGLDDYEEAFYQRAFKLCREEIRRIITRAYVKAGPWYICKSANPLLLPVMRTLHTSLEFAPLLAGLDGEEPGAVAAVLDGTTIRHEDGMETTLFIKQSTAQHWVLCGTFHPLGKAYTVTLIP